MERSRRVVDVVIIVLRVRTTMFSRNRANTFVRAPYYRLGAGTRESMVARARAEDLNSVRLDFER